MFTKRPEINLSSLSLNTFRLYVCARNRTRWCVYVCLFSPFFQFCCLHVNKFIRLPISLLQVVREMDTKNTVLPLLFQIPVYTNSNSLILHKKSRRSNTYTHTQFRPNIMRKEKWKSHRFHFLRSIPVDFVQQVLVFGFAVLFIWLRFLYSNLSCLPAVSHVLYIALCFSTYDFSVCVCCPPPPYPPQCFTRNFRSDLMRFHIFWAGITGRT